ncbi:hypothetical protein SODALDRAFT_11275 [Sodiomyces alkalinus F11]|uniref:Uncharacterized protein n=1 Tax=Sodiomyces alkalinus (strain CBS 110278 / VKM F-3762 / F11) TaxID=1314773 RepID=A0A3N2Q659_SODAK|nr:hypothetical protein SODALDRAFT_11275 [Sodiomyces alkalinus F11]ROT42264.1 hypothetical protein SODALDRAFT_11275 [Sodiomyces alkalinus F11]
MKRLGGELESPSIAASQRLDDGNSIFPYRLRHVFYGGYFGRSVCGVSNSTTGFLPLHVSPFFPFFFRDPYGERAKGRRGDTFREGEKCMENDLMPFSASLVMAHRLNIRCLESTMSGAVQHPRNPGLNLAREWQRAVSYSDVWTLNSGRMFDDGNEFTRPGQHSASWSITSDAR